MLRATVVSTALLMLCCCSRSAPPTNYSQPTAYSKPCACPEDRDSAGRRCGKRSAWSKAGGASPMCNADGTRA
jgi:hypothetical protein